MSPPPTDPFDTAGLRAAVLDAWRASPTRYREDANVEEDYALGAYRDRLIVELAQNGSDAARAADVPCRIKVIVGDDGLTVANTGAALDAAGVQSMAAMRASAKSDNSVGRFGVGFAAVLTATNAPAIVSRNGSVRFSRADSATLMKQDVTLGQLLTDRQPPVLRLPFAHESEPPPGYDTAIVMPWRDATARERANEAIAAIDDALFIALPNLVEVSVERVPGDGEQRWSASRSEDVLTITVDGVERSWRLKETAGEWSQRDLADAPTESRNRTRWSLTWAVPVDADGALALFPTGAPNAPAQVIHAPTPTDEPLALLALLVGSFPVDATRRRLAEGAMTDAMVDAAARAYVELIAEAAAMQQQAAVALVPAPNLVGPVDARLRAAVRDQLSHAMWVERADGGAVAAPTELVAVEPQAPELVHAVASHVSDLLAPSWLSHVSVLRGLGLSVRTWSEVWDVLAQREVSAVEWHVIYDAATTLDRTALEGLPIPLNDGRIVRDPRNCVVPEDESAEWADALGTLGLSVVDPLAAHPLLERLGARPFDARHHLDAGLVARVRGAVADDEAEARAIVVAAATVLQASDVRPGEVATLGDVLVPTRNDWTPAAEVALPGTPLGSVVGEGSLLDAELARDHRDGWLALGVLGELTVVSVGEMALDPDEWGRLVVGGADWCEDVADRLAVASAADLLAVSAQVVRGLEFVGTLDAAQALALLSAPGVRAAVVEPALVLDASGRTQTVPSVAAAWLAELPLFDGRAPIDVRLPGDDRLAPFFPEIASPVGEVDAGAIDAGAIDAGLLAAMGVHTSLEAWLAEPSGVDELLVAMADSDIDIPDDLVPALYESIGKVISGMSADPELPDPPERVRALVGGQWQVVDASDAVVAVAPHHAAVLSQPFVPGDEPLAELLDAEVSDDAACEAIGVRGTGNLLDVPAAAALGVSSYYEHDALTINGVDVDWWVTDDGEVHACTVDGLARGLAWASGQWSRRWALSAMLSEPDHGPLYRLESYYDRHEG